MSAPTLAEAPPVGRQRKLLSIASLLAILVVAALLRFNGLTAQCLWFDEIWHVQLSNGWDSSSFLKIPIDQYIPQQPNYVQLKYARPWHTIPAHVDYVLQPPLYYLVLRPWRAVVGETPGCLRGFSTLMSLAALLLTFEAGRRCAGVAVGLGAAVLMAVSLNQIDQAHDGRGYALLMTVSLPTGLLLQSLLNPALSRRAVLWRSIAVALGVLTMMFTHYFAAGACLGLGLFAILFLRGRARWLTLSGMAIAGVVYGVLWFPSLHAQLGCIKETADNFLTDPAPGHPARTIKRLAALPMNVLADTDPAEQTSPLRIALGLALAGIAAASVIRHGRRAALWALWFAGTIAVVAAMDLARHTLHLTFIRYVMLSSPALCILLAMHLDAARWWRGLLITLPILGVELVTLAGGTPWHTADVRPMCAYVQSHVRPGDVMVLPARHHLGHDAQALYLYLAYYTDVFPTNLIVPTHPIEPTAKASAPPDANWWLISMTPIDLDRTWPGAKVIEAQTFEAAGGVGIVARVQPPG